MSEDLIKFLYARFREGEVQAYAALDAARGAWEATGRDVHAVLLPGPTRQHVVTARVDAIAAHIASQGPGRVMDEIAAKRRIVDQYGARRDAGLEIAVRLLSSLYADHPDYRPEWRLGA